MARPRRPYCINVTFFRRLTLLTALLAASAPAAQAQTNSPPGNAGVSEYQESVPTADGGSTGAGKHDEDKPSGDDSTTESAPATESGSSLSEAERKRLKEKGRDGKAVEKLVDGTRADASGASAKGDDESDSGGSVAGSVGSAAAGGGSDDAGTIIPIVVIVAAAGFAAFALLRRRRSA